MGSNLLSFSATHTADDANVVGLVLVLSGRNAMVVPQPGCPHVSGTACFVPLEVLGVNELVAVLALTFEIDQRFARDPFLEECQVVEEVGLARLSPESRLDFVAKPVDVVVWCTSVLMKQL